jgi:hypothetical protein
VSEAKPAPGPRPLSEDRIRPLLRGGAIAPLTPEPSYSPHKLPRPTVMLAAAPPRPVYGVEATPVRNR